MHQTLFAQQLFVMLHVKTRAVHLQDEEADVLPEADVAMVARSISASLGILQEDHAALLLPFLQQSGLRQIQTDATDQSLRRHTAEAQHPPVGRMGQSHRSTSL